MTEIVVIFNNRKRLQLGKVLTTVYWRVFFILVLVVCPLFTTTLRFPAQFCPLFAARTLSQTTSPHSALIFPCESKIKAPLPSSFLLNVQYILTSTVAHLSIELH